MAEVTAMRNNALPYPVFGAPWAVVFPLLDNDGDLVSGAAGLDSEVSLNGDAFADCTDEATEIGSSGMYYLLLTAAEMTADVVTVIVKTSTTDAKTTVLTFYPRKLVPLRAGTAQGGAVGSITLDSGASPVDDYYNGCLVIASIDGVTECRIIDDYVGSTKVASVSPDFNTAPDADDTFTIYLPEGRQISQADAVAFGGADGTFAAGRPEVNATHVGGTVQTAGDIVADTNDIQGRLPAALVSGRIDARVGAMANDVMTAAAAAADFSQEIRSEIDTNSTQLAAIVSALATVAAYIDTEVAVILATVATEVADIKAKTDNLPGDPASQSGVETAIAAVLTTALVESYAANGAAPTLTQAIMAIHQVLMHFSIAGITKTVKQLDDSSTAFTATLDSATTPTSIART